MPITFVPTKDKLGIRVNKLVMSNSLKHHEKDHAKYLHSLKLGSMNKWQLQTKRAKDPMFKEDRCKSHSLKNKRKK